jgi:hypothetical protein
MTREGKGSTTIRAVVKEGGDCFSGLSVAVTKSLEELQAQIEELYNVCLSLGDRCGCSAPLFNPRGFGFKVVGVYGFRV